MDQRGALLPILGRAVGLDDFEAGRQGRQNATGVAADRIGRKRHAEREPVLRKKPILMLRRGAAGHAEAVIGEHLAGAGDMAEHAVEDAPPGAVRVHAELEEMAQKAAALRYPEAERMIDGPAFRQHRVAVGLETQERDEVAYAGEADAEHFGLCRLIPQLINPERLEFASFRQEADRARVDEFPFAAWDLGTRLALAIAHDEPSRRLVERGDGVGEAVGAAIARAARADVELVADAAGDRVAVLHRCRKICAEPGIGARRARVPAGPDERIAAPEKKAEAGVLLGLRVVGAGRIGGGTSSSSLKIRFEPRFGTS